MFNKLFGGYDQLWKAIIRPPRDKYEERHLGKKDFVVKNIRVVRKDIKLTNNRNLVIECSFFQPKNMKGSLPCVIYLHGNSSSRMEALQTIDTLLPQKIQMFCFDFSGCGLSEGEYISLGHYEREDLSRVIEFLRNSEYFLYVAITSLMHADRDPSIAGMIIDSAMTDLKTLAEELCKQHVSLPNFVLSGALSLVRKSVKEKAGFDINDLQPIKHCSESFVPALFVAAYDDTFILPSHTKKLFEGDKNLIMVQGDHNSQRPQFLLDSIGIFFHNTLQCDLIEEKFYEEQLESQRNHAIQSQQVRAHIGNEDEVEQMFEELSEQEMLEKAIIESLKLNHQEEKNNEDKDFQEYIGEEKGEPKEGQ